MRIAYFTHSLRSCWNHGNAHFLRGLFRELGARGHDVQGFEPAAAWSVENLLADAGVPALDAWREAYPDLQTTLYRPDTDLASLVQDADLVIVHEWNDPALVAAIGRLRRTARFTLLFHDTHHRAVSEPEAMRRYELDEYDGVLAFGATLAEVYRRWGWAGRVHVWHEAADVAWFHPPATEVPRQGAVWIGNWGDGERTAELEDFLLRPTQQAGLPLDIYGVRYPEEACALLVCYGVAYRGWLPNHRAPAVFARHRLTVHVPRRFYSTVLPGIPTIRVFEALACGIPLLSAPWHDAESLFTPGQDFLFASTGAAMQAAMHDLLHDTARRDAMVAHGLATIRARHTCGHRADELLAIVARLRQPNFAST